MVNKARVIVFETSGVIALKRELIVRPGYGNLTIAGQTALRLPRFDGQGLGSKKRAYQ